MAPRPSSAKDQETSPFRLFQRGGNYALPKSNCPNRSEWRVLPGKSPERLSPYYQIGCEFGSALILSWRNEGSEPVYVCGEHAKQFEYCGARASGSEASSETNEKEEEMASEDGAVPSAAPVAVAVPVPVPVTVPSAVPSTVPLPVSVPVAVAAPRQEFPALPKVETSTPEDRHKAARPARSPAEQRAAIDQLISDLTTQLETAISQSNAAISVAVAIDAPLEQAALAIIGSPELSDAQKDASVQALGALQESLKQGAGQDITALQAHQIRQVVEHRLSGGSDVAEEAKAGYRAVHESLESAIRAAAPRAKHLEERLANLLKMKEETESSSKARELTPVVA